MKKFYVYCVFSSESEEVLYVGKGSGDRVKVSLDRLSRKHSEVLHFRVVLRLTRGLGCDTLRGEGSLGLMLHLVTLK